MKSREIEKQRHLSDYVAEKIMEWVEYLLYVFRRKREWTSNLTESYEIYCKYIDKDFVREFLNEREKILKLNRYKMVTKAIPGEGKDGCIGKVILHRKKRVISQAILKTKKNDKLIYWAFEN